MYENGRGLWLLYLMNGVSGAKGAGSLQCVGSEECGLYDMGGPSLPLATSYFVERRLNALS